MKRINMRKMAMAVLAAASITMLAAGCQMDELQGLLGIGPDDIKVSFEGGAVTKACQEVFLQDTTVELARIETGTLWMTRMVSSTDDSGLYQQKGRTKGVPVTTDNLVSKYGNQVSMAAYDAVTGNAYIPAQPMSFNSSKSVWKTTVKDYLWPDNNANLKFWAWAPNGSESGTVSPTINASSGSLAFSYVTPKSTGGTTDAEAQKDVLLACCTANQQTWPEDHRVHMTFRHALSAIRFEIGKTDACTVNSISLKNVKSAGTCTFTASSTPTVGWELGTATANFTQTFNTQVDKSTSDSPTQDVDKSTTSKATFMLIPQTYTESNKITLEVKLTLTDSGEQVILTKELDAALTGWEAGNTYTYVLSIANRLEISVEDTVTDNTKRDVEIRNTASSTVKCYIRAAVIGNWFDGDGKIVEAWKVEDESLTGIPTEVGVANDKNWTKGADGFYYYKYPVYPDTETGTGADGKGDPDKLFTSYHAPTAPLEDSYLSLSIVAQGVQWDTQKSIVTNAWGSTVAGYLSVTDK